MVRDQDDTTRGHAVPILGVKMSSHSRPSVYPTVISAACGMSPSSAIR